MLWRDFLHWIILTQSIFYNIKNKPGCLTPSKSHKSYHFWLSPETSEFRKYDLLIRLNQKIYIPILSTYVSVFIIFNCAYKVY